MIEYRVSITRKGKDLRVDYSEKDDEGIISRTPIDDLGKHVLETHKKLMKSLRDGRLTGTVKIS